MTNQQQQQQRRWAIAAGLAAVALSNSQCGVTAFSSPPSRHTQQHPSQTSTRLEGGGLLDAIGGAFDSLRRQFTGEDISAPTSHKGSTSSQLNSWSKTGASWKVTEETVIASSREFVAYEAAASTNPPPAYGAMSAGSAAPAKKSGYGKGSWKTSLAASPASPYVAAAASPVMKGAAVGSVPAASAGPTKSYGKGGAAKWKTSGEARQPWGDTNAASTSTSTAAPVAAVKKGSYAKGSWKTAAVAPVETFTERVVHAAEQVASDVVSQMTGGSPIKKGGYAKGSWKTKTPAVTQAAAVASAPQAAVASPQAAVASPVKKGAYAKGSWKTKTAARQPWEDVNAAATPKNAAAHFSPPVAKKSYAKGSWKSSAKFAAPVSAVSAESAAAPVMKGASAPVASSSPGPSKGYGKSNAAWKTSPPKGGGYLDTFSSADTVAAEMIDSSRSAAVEAVSPVGVAKSSSGGAAKSYAKGAWKSNSSSWKAVKRADLTGRYNPKTNASWKTTPPKTGGGFLDTVASAAPVETSAAVAAPVAAVQARPAKSVAKSYAKGSWKSSAPRQPWEDVNSSKPSVDLMPPPPSASVPKSFAKGSWKTSSSPAAPAAAVQAAAPAVPAAKGSAGPKGGFGLGSWKK